MKLNIQPGADLTLLVFDLDFTLWDAGGTWVDHTRPPFRLRNGDVFDADNSCIRLYPDVLPLLAELKNKAYPIAVASKTGEPDWAREVLDLFDIRHYFAFEEIYPGTKTRHFHQLAIKSGTAFENMIFFDDEYANIRDVSALNVTAIHVQSGITRRLVMNAIKHST